MQEFIYNNIILSITLFTLIISTIITIYGAYLAYDRDKELYNFCRNITFWKYAIEYDYVFMRGGLVILITFLISMILFGTIYLNYENVIIEQHKNNPCPQCQYKKYEDIWYDKDGIEHKETQLIWQRCPTLK